MTVHYFPLSTACMSLYKIIQSRCAQTRVVPSCTEYSAEKGNRKPDWNNNPFPPGKKERQREREKRSLPLRASEPRFFRLNPFTSTARLKGQGTEEKVGVDWSRDDTSIGNDDRWRVQWRTTTRRRWRKSTRVSHARWRCQATCLVPASTLSPTTFQFLSSVRSLIFPAISRPRARQYNVYIFPPRERGRRIAAARVDDLTFAPCLNSCISLCHFLKLPSVQRLYILRWHAWKICAFK